MADIDTVLERLVNDAAFRDRLASDPAAALADYDLTADDLQLLASSLDDTDAGQRGVEQRTSKSAVLGLLASMTGGGGAGGARDLGDAPGDGATESKYMKFEDIKGESADSEDEALRKVSGQRKYQNITLKRGADTSAAAGDELAPADPDGAEEGYAFKQGFPVKWQGANAAPDDADAPLPVGEGDEAGYAFKQGFPVKWQGANAAPDDADAPLPVGEGDEAGYAFKQGFPVKWQGASAAPAEEEIPAVGSDDGADETRAWPKKIEYSGAQAGDPAAGGDLGGDGRGGSGGGTTAAPEEDFLTIEDE